MIASLDPETVSDPRSIAVLGSTGSIGRNTLDLVRRRPSAYRVVALTANRNVDLLIQQALEVRPTFAAIADATLHDRLAAGLAGTNIGIGSGPGAVVDAAALPAAWVMAAIVGAAGLEPTLT
ncbi:MAG: 1-deoxy-D-xylulose-5-phosphate reductoisomerase, partial [Alphaproteobacteria bacterium]|nr:1-deoxy-D-xylulose-5-phosphate reductoisomerase [Alphaproteobacteria bacterium]